MEEFYNMIRQWYNPTKHAGILPANAEKMLLGRSPGLNLVRAERSRMCIFAYVKKTSIKGVSTLTNEIDNALGRKTVSKVDCLKRIDKYSRSAVEMELELAPGESRGYWKYHAPSKWFKQAKATGKINNEKASLLFDSGAEISIVDTAFARKFGCVIEESQRQGCVGIGESA